MKAKLALLEANPSTSQTPKTFQQNNKGLVVKTFDWDEEEVSDDEEVTQVKVLMALADDDLTIRKHVKKGSTIELHSKLNKTSLSGSAYIFFIWICLDQKKSQAPEMIMFFIRTDHLGKFDAKADDGYFLGYSCVSKDFKVFNTRRQQVDETYHVAFDKSIEDIRFTNTSEYEIRIDDSFRYPPDKFVHKDDPFRQYQTDSDISYSVIPHGCLFSKLTQENHVPEVIAPNEPDIPLTEDTEGPPDLINTEGTHEQNVQNEQIITQPTKGPSGNNTKVLISINKSLVPDVPQSRISNKVSTSSHPVPQDRWSKDQHIKLVNIIGDPSEGMLTKSMAAKLIAASANECLFADFLFEIKPKRYCSSVLLTKKIYVLQVIVSGRTVNGIGRQQSGRGRRTIKALANGYGGRMSNPITLGEAFPIARATEARFAKDALSKLLTIEERPTTLVEAFSLARMIETRFENERTTTTIVNPNDLNIAIPHQVLKKSIIHTSDKVEITSDNDARAQASEVEMKVLVDGKQDDAKVVKVMGVAVEQNNDKPNLWEGVSKTDRRPDRTGKLDITYFGLVLGPCFSLHSVFGVESVTPVLQEDGWPERPEREKSKPVWHKDYVI
uniref:Retrovirus-related Pol polyprotein from transposon TNT 1-94 n=1 Tax=Tanacetum cinerariifolium TaxID=118510 RepID=A0A6L2KFC6_TANCI|nr:retrovirus-related Pol polyprotein from transposon TNT 1-94 [Tanacetum cinerariifolium]